MEPKSTHVQYVIDTCSFIALTEIYPRDVFPGVWKKTEELVDDKKIISAEEVYKELSAKDDDIYKWASARRHMFKKLDDAIQRLVAEILNTHGSLIDVKNKKSSADPFLIATARVYGGIVVTEENLSGNENKPKIPDVCRAYNIEYIDILEMFKRTKLHL